MQQAAKLLDVLLYDLCFDITFSPVLDDDVGEHSTASEIEFPERNDATGDDETNCLESDCICSQIGDAPKYF